MKVPYILASAAFIGFVSLADAQNFPSQIFSPVDGIRPPGDNTGLLTVRVNEDTATKNSAPGTVVWGYSARGHIQGGANISALGIPVAELDAQLFASTRTTGTSLVFGRGTSLEASLLGAPVAGQDGNLNALLNTLVSANVLYNWSASATVTNLSIQSGQTYRVSFDVTSATGLPAGAISAASFGITTPGIVGVGGDTGTLLNLLNLVTIGDGSTNQVTFDFQSASNISSLDFNFAANSLLGANLLGGTGGNDYLTISGFNVAPVPEPSVSLLGVTFAGLMLARRRRVA